MSKVFTPEEVARHNTESDCWVIVDGLVFDVTKFLRMHPGGKKILAQEGGKDASKKFHMFHSASVFRKYKQRLVIGAVKGHEGKLKSSGSKRAAAAAAVKAPPAPPAGESKALIRTEPFGNVAVQYGEPSWYQGLVSPYYNESHVQWRAHVREFAETHLAPYVKEWDEAYKVPGEVYKLAAKAGILQAVIGPPWPSKYVDMPPPKDFDAFHELILIDELSRPGSGGLVWSLFGGLSIGLPPILHFGSEELKRKVAPACLRGEKFICLAITEPEGGSDVANLHTTARREGDHYIVNGAKKWITNGVWADYFTVAVRTGGPGHRGLSFLLIEKDMPGVTTRHMKCMGVWASGTTYITFEDVKVPVSNLIGEENKGFKYIMYNFNHERWSLVGQAMRFCRVLYEESFEYALKRKTFGKALMDHQMIREKLANMARQIEATQAWLENITYQMTIMPKLEINKKLGGTIALLKVQTTRVMEYCAREAAQIFGGASYVRGGAGEKVERLYRDVRAMAIPGGSEEILQDFAIRDAVRHNIAQRSKM